MSNYEPGWNRRSVPSYNKRETYCNRQQKKEPSLHGHVNMQ